VSFWKKLFGGSDGAASGGEQLGDAESYKGFTIRPRVMMAGSEFQLAGRIEKEIDGELKSYDFVRADRFGSRDDMQAMALSKGRQIIDEQGASLFQQTWPSKPN
jgi:hypothetical protein